MTAPTGWDAAAAITSCKRSQWSGSAWRAHKRKYLPTDPGGSLNVSGRYNRGLDQFPADQVWPALYLSLGPDICLGEILRHVTPALLPGLNDFRLSELRLELAVVLDCRAPALMDLTLEDFCHETDYRLTQHIAMAAIALGAEAILVPSATCLGDNLILFSANLLPTSRLTVVASRDPRLYVLR
ncbi:MAG: RES family NAD+ phosphorylase [Chloroflexota bacterium]